MRIHHSEPTVDSIALPVAALQDGRLSYAARGVLVDLLSRPDGTDVTAETLAQMASQRHAERRKGNGRSAIRDAFAELEDLGYLVRTRSKGGRGRFATTLDLYDTPGHQNPDEPGTGNHRRRYAYVYRHWDKDDHLLYVGVTEQPRKREWGHAKSSRWIELTVKTTTERYLSRVAAEVAESAAISSEQPLFNIAGNDGPDARKRVREYLTQRGRMDLMPSRTRLPRLPNAQRR